MSRNEIMMYGTAIGITVGLVISIIVLKAFNKDGKMKTEWDEMQKIARGEAYKYGFWAMMIAEALFLIVASGNVQLPWDGFMTHFLVILIGVMVQASYSIWKGAYIGLNTNTERFGIGSVVIALFNFVIAGIAAASGQLFVDGKMQSQGANLFIGIMFIVLGVEMLAKKMVDNGAKED